MDVAVARKLVKDMLGAFDAASNRERLKTAIKEAKEEDDLVLKAAPLAMAIASEAFFRSGIDDDFATVMTTLARLAATDEHLAYDVFALKEKFLPYPPDEPSVSSHERLAKLKNVVRFASSLDHTKRHAT